MIDQLSKDIVNARKEVATFLNKGPKLYELASYYKCTLEWHEHRPNEYNTECVRLINDYCQLKNIRIEGFY